MTATAPAPRAVPAAPFTSAPAPATAAARHHREHDTDRTTVRTRTADPRAGVIDVTLFGDGSTGVALRAVVLGMHEVTAYVELDRSDTIGRVTGCYSNGHRLPPYHRHLAGHTALRAAIIARARLRTITTAHARPRRAAC